MPRLDAHTPVSPRDASWDYDKSLLLIMETDLEARFPYVEEVLCRDKHVLPLTNVTANTLASTLLAKFRLRHEVSEAYRALRTILPRYRFIFLSNTEGFIAKNIVRWIKRDAPTTTLLSMQHGMVILEHSRGKRLLTSGLNKWTESVMDYSVAGEGFINKDVDFYLVYNQHYKSVLVSAGVPEGHVVISSVLLKGDTFIQTADIHSGANGNTALFLLQCLSALAITDEQTETDLVRSVVAWLSTHYERVLIKQHPYRDIALGNLPKNCRVVTGEIAALARECGTAVSFFSVALLECEHLGLRTIAVKGRSMNIKPDTYSIFESVGSIEPDGSLAVTSQARAFSRYYESEVASAGELARVVRADQS
jgi:hypothetical protein